KEYYLLFLGAAFVWSFVMTLIILFIMNKIPGLALRASDEAISEGIDYDQFNEYTHDYIEYQRDLYITKPTSVNSFMTVTPVDNIDNENVVQKQNEIKMIKINTIPTIQEAW
ncbi:unnamed protein product, partial [Adineta steineri]